MELEVSNKNCREAPVRALASSADTRTWNLLIDVVAQTGTMPAGIASAGNFVVQGESRYWLQVAIDRYTGQILDQTLGEVPTRPVAINFGSTPPPQSRSPRTSPAVPRLHAYRRRFRLEQHLDLLACPRRRAMNAFFYLSGNTLQTTGTLSI